MAGRPAGTYIHLLCANTGCSPGELPETMDDREGWWERIRDIRADSVTWRWWKWWKEIQFVSWGFLVLTLTMYFYLTVSDFFSQQRLLIIFHESLRESKSPLVFRILLNILPDLNNAVVWMVSIRPPISNSLNLLSKPSGSVSSAPIPAAITVLQLS